MINLHESMVPGRDRTRDPWICSQTRVCQPDTLPTALRGPVQIYLEILASDTSKDRELDENILFSEHAKCLRIELHIYV